ncbi:hypothetical protein BT96DRAFT_969619 [Gymnopus androsaceus JB14]|uniref:Uncharacterized protein n=1 Tax=Gymnopus androsaceus JB14 TaxID=1447944 RepID=A0A6A4IMC0_9AGAR|nr:hypothetical protein BT96DRAFT_969619 [Gymnopus androsaceus JB14]
MNANLQKDPTVLMSNSAVGDVDESLEDMDLVYPEDPLDSSALDKVEPVKEEENEPSIAHLPEDKSVFDSSHNVVPQNKSCLPVPSSSSNTSYFIARVNSVPSPPTTSDSSRLNLNLRWVPQDKEVAKMEREAKRNAKKLEKERRRIEREGKRKLKMDALAKKNRKSKWIPWVPQDKEVAKMEREAKRDAEKLEKKCS